MTASTLIAGTILHARADAIAHRTFRYPLYMAALDLAELPHLDRALRLFSHNRRNVFALDDRDYEGGHAALLAGNAIAAPARTLLVTNLRVFGYTFNPVSFFLGYDAHGALACAIAEVNNTYGGRFRYVLGPRERIDRLSAPSFGDGRVGFRAPRELYVSPFLHGDVHYEFWFDARAPTAGAAATIAMFVTDAESGARILTARFDGACTTLADRALARAAVRYPLMTAQVIGLIHYEAWKLRRAGVPYRRPGADHRPLPR